jgi:ubiquinol-cytochrome c reductase iron-sulfur subunit
VDIGKLEDGAMMRVEWRGRPVWVLKRTERMLEAIEAVESELRDPDSSESQQPEYASNQFRSIQPGVFVVVGSCTHLGCSPLPRFDTEPMDLGPGWQGGFYCPCHGSKFDLAGRVWKGVPAPLNLVVPPHRYVGESTILVGDDTGTA